jgi:hypothetical protein
LSRPFWRSLKVGLWVVLIGVVVFVGLTRTQVGRDALRSQLETAFNQRFEGRLSIGEFQGTWVDDVIAQEVQLRAPNGDLVATVDSMHAQPQWANLLTAELSIRTLTVVRPRLSLARDANGSWNVTRAFRRRSPSSSSGPSVDVSIANIAVREGQAETTRAGAAPSVVQTDWLFDYTRTALTEISLEASAQRAGPQRYLEIQHASFALPELGIQASSLEGVLRKTSSGWSLSGADLSLENTRLRGDASLSPPSTDDPPSPFSLDLDRSRIDNGELKRIVPRLPLAKTVTIEGGLRGAGRRVRVDDLTLTHGSSFATLDGTVETAPEPLRLDLQLRESSLAPTDVQDVWPGLPAPPNSEMGPFTLTGTVRGTVSRSADPKRRLDLEATLDAQSPHGTLEGSVELARQGAAPFTSAASLTTRNLDLAPLTGRPRLSSQLTGRIEAQATAVDADTLAGTVNLSLSPSQIAGRPLASAEAAATVANGSVEGTLTVQQADGGAVSVEGAVDRLNGRPHYTAVVRGTEFNLAPVTDGLPTTDLNARLTIDAAGSDWRPLIGTADLRVDSSSVYRGDSTVTLPRHSVRVRLSDRDARRPRIDVAGSVARLSVDGTTLGPPLWTTAQTWATALREAVRQERHKPAPSQALAGVPAVPPPDASTDRSELRAQAEAALTEMASPGLIDAEATLRVKRPDIVHAWWAAFPQRADDLEASAALTIGADSLYATGQASASLLQSGTNEIENLEAEYELSGQFDEPLAQSTRVAAQMSASRMEVGGPPLQNPTASLTYGGRSGTLQVTAGRAGIVDTLNVAGNLRITPTKNELRLYQFSLGINGSRWSNSSPASIFAYAGTLEITPLLIRSPHPETPSFQRLRLAGTISGRPTDTLSVDTDNVYLPPFSKITGMAHTIGGELDGELHLRSAWDAPRLVGDLSVRRLSYDRRVLGDARLHAEYAVQSPDLRVDGSLRTTVARVDSLAGPDLVPGGARTVDPNRISLSGRVRLPTSMRADAPAQASKLPPDETLDLSVDVDRADLFFFRYIFEKRVSSIQGYATGPLHIGGQFRDPIFEADLSILNGAVSLPLFGLKYQIEGDVEVDRRGIHPKDLAVQDEDGRATINGSLLFNDYQYFSFDLSSTLDGITVIDVSESEDLPFYGHIRASGPLSLTGPLSDASLTSDAARTTPDSELYIPVSGRSVDEDSGYILFADSTGQALIESRTRRQSILGDRPEGVPSFVDGLNIDLNVIAPDESTVHLVFDPLVGDVVTVVGSGRVQLQRLGGEFSVFGNFDATGGTYLFTAGEVFVRRFSIDEGTITWDGNPTNAMLNLNADYRTRASTSGLPGLDDFSGRIPVTVQLDVTGRVATPQVDLGLSLSQQNDRNPLVGSESLDAMLNQPARTTEYATSVLLTNTFLLTTESVTQDGTAGGGDSSNRLTTAGNQLAFNSVSQLVSSQLNRYLGQALPNVDLNFGVQGEDPDDLDLIYGVALRLLNERLIIRGEGVYTGNDSAGDPNAQQPQGPQGEFVVEVRLSPSVSANFFYRRTAEELTRNQALTTSRGAGLSYQTQFPNWGTLFGRVFGWLLPDDSDAPEDDSAAEPVAEQPVAPSDSSTAPNRRR